jgi:TctA family transporter
MFRKMVETIVGGALGLLALYAVAKVAYQEGKDAAKRENQPEKNPGDTVSEKQPEEAPVKKKRLSNLGLLLGLRKAVKAGGSSFLGMLASRPEDHKLEAFVDGDDLQIHVRKRRPVTPR